MSGEVKNHKGGCSSYKNHIIDKRGRLLLLLKFTMKCWEQNILQRKKKPEAYKELASNSLTIVAANQPKWKLRLGEDKAGFREHLNHRALTSQNSENLCHYCLFRSWVGFTLIESDFIFNFKNLSLATSIDMPNTIRLGGDKIYHFIPWLWLHAAGFMFWVIQGLRLGVGRTRGGQGDQSMRKKSPKGRGWNHGTRGQILRDSLVPGRDFRLYFQCGGNSREGWCPLVWHYLI